MSPDLLISKGESKYAMERIEAGYRLDSKKRGDRSSSYCTMLSSAITLW